MLVGGAHEEALLVKLATIHADSLSSKSNQMYLKKFLVAHTGIYIINLDFGNNFNDDLLAGRRRSSMVSFVTGGGCSCFKQ